MTEPQLLLGFSQRFLIIITFHNLQTCLHLSRISKSSRPSNSIMPLNKRSGSKSQFGFNEFTDALILNTFPSTFCQIILVGIVFNSFTFDSSRFPSLHSCVSSSTVAAVQVQCYCYRAGMDECENTYQRRATWWNIKGNWNTDWPRWCLKTVMQKYNHVTVM